MKDKIELAKKEYKEKLKSAINEIAKREGTVIDNIIDENKLGEKIYNEILDREFEIRWYIMEKYNVFMFWYNCKNIIIVDLEE